MIVIGVGGLKVTNRPGECIRTFGLGSCVAVVLIHPPTKTVGMVHVALWNSQINPDKAISHPGFFADTGISALIRQMGRQGVPQASFGKDVIVKIAGGAQVMDPHNTFKIGQKNADAIIKILSSKKMLIAASDIGKQFSRTVSVFVEDGKVILSSPGKTDWQL